LGGAFHERPLWPSLQCAKRTCKRHLRESNISSKLLLQYACLAPEKADCAHILHNPFFHFRNNIAFECTVIRSRILSAQLRDHCTVFRQTDRSQNTRKTPHIQIGGNSNSCPNACHAIVHQIDVTAVGRKSALATVNECLAEQNF